MAIGDTAIGTIRLHEATLVPPDARVRHFDELDDEEQERFLALIDDRAVPDDGRSFADGEIIVFTDYYRVSRA